MMGNPQVILWVAGLLCGLGGGLMLGRIYQPQAVTSAPGLTTETGSLPAPHGTGSLLFDPIPATAPAYLSRPAETKFHTQPRLRVENTSNEPNPFPQGEAAPVQAQEPLLNSRQQTPREQTDSLPVSGFRQQLESLAPELDENAIAELERIREIIESPRDRTVNLKTMLNSTPVEGSQESHSQEESAEQTDCPETTKTADTDSKSAESPIPAVNKDQSLPGKRAD